MGQEAGPQDVPSCPAPGQATFARCVCSCILLKRERRREHAPRPGGGPRGCPWHEGKPAPSWIIHQFLAAQRMHPCSQAPFSVGASVCGHLSPLSLCFAGSMSLAPSAHSEDTHLNLHSPDKHSLSLFLVLPLKYPTEGGTPGPPSPDVPAKPVLGITRLLMWSQPALTLYVC